MGNSFAQKFETFGSSIGQLNRQAGDVAARPSQACDKTDPNRVCRHGKTIGMTEVACFAATERALLLDATPPGSATSLRNFEEADQGDYRGPPQGWAQSHPARIAGWRHTLCCGDDRERPPLCQAPDDVAQQGMLD